MGLRLAKGFLTEESGVRLKEMYDGQGVFLVTGSDTSTMIAALLRASLGATWGISTA